MSFGYFFFLLRSFFVRISLFSAQITWLRPNNIYMYKESRYTEHDKKKRTTTRINAPWFLDTSFGLVYSNCNAYKTGLCCYGFTLISRSTGVPFVRLPYLENLNLITYGYVSISLLFIFSFNSTTTKRNETNPNWMQTDSID